MYDLRGIRPDWQMVGTISQAEYQLPCLKVKGPGWHIYENHSVLVLDHYLETSAKLGLHIFMVWNNFDPRNTLRATADLKVQVNESK